MNASLKIKIFDAKGTHLVPISKSTVTVGSAPHCDVVLNHSSVMPEHIRAWCEGGRIWVQDLSSNSGTAVNGIRLPPLKPMLLREIDVLKLGECPATLSMEPNLVRAPVVNKVNLDEFTATDVKAVLAAEPNERSHGDVDKLNRELAELKLQLQMAKLDRGALDELKKENQALKEDLQKAIEDKKKYKESAQNADGDKKNYRKQFETELNELKLKALREAKDQREEDQRKFEQWKHEAAARLAAAVNEVGHSKERAWITRPLSKDMMLEWAGDMNDLFREHLLGERPLPKAPEATSARHETAANKVSPQTATGVRPVPKTPKPGRRKKQESVFARFAIFGVVGAVILVAAFVLFKPKRRLEGSRASSSQSVPAPVDAPPAEQPQPPQPLQGQAGAQAQTLPPAPKPPIPVVKKPFAPSQDKVFKRTYTDNVLYTLYYAEAELNMDFRAMWIKDLNKVGKGQWKMDARTLGSIATNELVMIQDLNRMRNAIGPASDSDRVGQMRTREAQFVKELTRQLGKKASLEKFMNLKRAFYNRNQVYLSRETR